MSIPLPLDPDLGPQPRSTPLHRDPQAIALVALGGVAGTMCRQAVSWIGAWFWAAPWMTMVENLAGAFVLGILVPVWAGPAGDHTRQRRMRLLCGTGLLGSFTTYSALAADAVALIQHHPLLGALYALGTVVLGLGAAAAGMAWGWRWSRRRSEAAS